jgi:hypothetical protein
MVRAISEVLRNLYETDETAWLETMADLIKQGRLQDLDYTHLGEYLEDMARRDRREVKSRLVTLLAHLLKWTILPQAYANAVKRAVVETGLPADTFPAECPYNLEQVLSAEVDE